MNKKLLLSCGLTFILIACGEPKKTPLVVDPNPTPLEKIDETLRPANPVSSAVLAQWRNLAAKNAALIPATEAYFSGTFYQGSLTTVSPENSRKATEKLSAEGKKNLSYALRRCQLQAPYATTSTAPDGSLVIGGITSVGGDYCLYSMNEAHSVTKKVTAKTSDSETFYSTTQSKYSMTVKDITLRNAVGIFDSIKTLQVSGTYLRYPKSPYAYATAQVKVQGQFSVTLATGDVVAGALKGDATLGANASSLYLLEATTAQGDIRLITKRSGNQIKYILNGVETDPSAIPAFLHLAQEY